MQKLSKLTKPGGHMGLGLGKANTTVVVDDFSWITVYNTITIITGPECKIGVLSAENLNKYIQ